MNLADGLFTLTQLTDLPELTHKPTLLDTSKTALRTKTYMWVNKVSRGEPGDACRA